MAGRSTLTVCKVLIRLVTGITMVTRLTNMVSNIATEDYLQTEHPVDLEVLEVVADLVEPVDLAELEV